ncbi:DNA translocase FtsK 4TM domain-containing protein [Myxococcota bacterium]|nr:DNA translocase FtsK 4TM domain-containing protein [Myxococcota bacterium]
MAKSEKKKKRTKGEGEDGERPEGGDVAVSSPARRLEIFGVLVLVVALALCIALFTFDPTDAKGRGNLVGPLGVHLANGLLGAVGVYGYFVAVALTIGAGAVIVGRLVRPSFTAILSFLSITVGATVLAHLIASGPVSGHPAGGVVGKLLGDAMREVAGAAGAALAATGALLVGVLGISDLSLGAALRDGFAFFRRTLVGAKGLVEAQAAAREAARIREEELLEAERARRAQQKLEAEERERVLREEMEEKKRVAVLKATTRAEEKALKKIAADEARERLMKEREELEAKAKAEAAEKARQAAEADEVIAVAVARTQLPKPASLADAERAEAEVALGIPGPAAEPKIVIREQKLDAADVLDQLAAAPERAAKGKKKGKGEEAPVVALVPSEPEHDTDAPAPADVESELPALAPGVDAVGAVDDVEEDTGEIKVYERKHVDPELVAKEEPTQPELPFAPKLEKKIYEMPPLHLLDYEGKPPEPIDPELLRSKATRLEEKLKTYGVEGRVAAIRPGPVVTTYEYLPAPGVKVSKIAALSDDIAMSMEAMRVRIVAPIPGKGVVGIELPNEKREAVYLKELIAHDSFKKSKSLLTLALGKDAEGEPQTRDLRSMPHILIAGTTGSGKSVSVNAMILSVLYKATPDQVKFIMVDPKMLELSLYEDIPHLLLPVVTDPRKASLALQWAVDEMERRYQMLSDFKVRDLDGFNKKLGKLRDQREADAKLAASERRRLEAEAALAEAEAEARGEGDGPLSEEAALMLAATTPEAPVAEVAPTPSSTPAHHDEHARIKDPWAGKDMPEALPYIVVLIDEFADLMCVAPRDVEASVQRLAQKARAAGIHVMLATQRPSTDVITGVIKNNFPTRISFRVASRHDSATILNAPGAENLLGMGDMLCLGVTSPSPVRIHGAFVSEEEVQRVVEFWKAQAKPTYDATILQKRDDDGEDGDGEPIEHDEMYDKAVAIVAETRKASISAIQRRLRVGYNRAARMIEMMESEGIVGPAVGPKGEREVLIRAIEGA